MKRAETNRADNANVTGMFPMSRGRVGDDW